MKFLKKLTLLIKTGKFIKKKARWFQNLWINDSSGFSCKNAFEFKSFFETYHISNNDLSFEFLENRE